MRRRYSAGFGNGRRFLHIGMGASLGLLALSQLGGIARADERPLELGAILGGHFFSSTSALGRSDYAAPGSDIRSSVAVGARLGYALSPYFLLEGEFVAMPTQLVERTSQVLAYSGRGHLLFRWPVGHEGRWQPFVLAGGGVIGVRPSPGLPLRTENLGAFHTGLGLRVNINNYVGVRLDGRMQLVPEVRTPTFTQDWEVLASVYARLGFAPEKPPEPPKPVDLDNDGIVDKDDRCPNEAGPAENGGCPDKDIDHDTLIDRLDKCPDKAGPVENSGCPDTDGDGDGVVDRLDRCPALSGPKANGGCPDTDADGDGIVDRLDKCPTEAETQNNYQDTDGCPDELPQAVAKFVGKIEGIRFAPNKAVLLPESFKVLDQAVLTLQENSWVRLEVAGHTDNIGVPELNMQLSQQRADSVKAYLESKGVQPGRLTAVGFGMTKPVAENTTPTGRAQNRRVEFKLLPAVGGAPKAVVPAAPVKPVTPAVPAAAPAVPVTPTVPPAATAPVVPTVPAPPTAAGGAVVPSVT
ncbi:MAG: OmpA family protein, partial [Deltaproteobacteria bacterium]|nr:OmpA family protein [Deltaproteobacteria bacterium]